MDDRLYIERECDYWLSARGQRLFKVRDRELAAAEGSMDRIIRETETQVLVLRVDPKKVVQSRIEKGTESEITKRVVAKVKARKEKVKK